MITRSIPILSIILLLALLLMKSISSSFIFIAPSSLSITNKMRRIPVHSCQITNNALKLSSFIAGVGRHHPTRHLSMMSTTRTELFVETSSRRRENRPTALLQKFATASSLFASTRHADYSTTTDVVDLKYSKFLTPPPPSQQQPQQQPQDQYPQ